MKSFLRRLGRKLRNVAIHFGPALLCVLKGEHRDLRHVGEFGKKGFRGVPMYQCAKCMMFYVRESDARKLGGK